MEMKDYLVRGMSMDGFVKVVAIRSTETVRRGAEIQGTTPNATAAFGRCLTAASMMGNMQKVENGSMTLQVRGGGPIGTITVVSDPVGNVRGCVTEPKVPLVEKYPGKLDVGATVGTDGTITVIRDLQMKEPYIGSTELISGEIGDDVTAYFAQSEQTPTACALGVLVDTDCSVKVAGGYLVQLLPGAPDETIDALEAGIKRAGAVTKMLEAGMTPEDILGQVCGALGVVFMETTEVSYKCYCSRDRVESALISLGKKELEEIRSEGKTFPVECQFCDTVYEFTPADLEEILSRI
jgi:molecular chaperone Hsp33